MLGRFDPKSLSYTRIAPPHGKSPHREFGAIAVDQQGHVWFMQGGLLFQYNPASSEFSSYDPAFSNGGGSGISTLGFLHGNVWGTGIGSHQILKLDPHAQTRTRYPVPQGSHPYGMAIGGDEMIWYVAHLGNEIGRLNPSTGELSRHKIRGPRSEPHKMAADSEGNLWAAAQESGKLLKVDHRTGRITAYSPPTEDSGPYSVEVDKTRNLIWFSEYYTGKLGRFDPRTNSFVEFPLPSADVSPGFSDAKVTWIKVDPTSPNRILWGGGTTARIGYLETME